MCHRINKRDVIKITIMREDLSKTGNGECEWLSFYLNNVESTCS